jgi:hypothetical protein
MITMDQTEQSESLFTPEEIELLHKLIQPKFWDLLLLNKPKEKGG